MKKSRPIRKTDEATITITNISPGPNDCVHVDANGCIEVSVDNPNDHAVFGRIHDFDAATGTVGGHHGELALAKDPMSGRYGAMVNAGPVTNPAPTGNNKKVMVRDADSGDEAGNPFVALPFGSGTCPSSGSGSHANFGGGVQVAAKFAQKGKPIPVSFQLKAEGGSISGTQLHHANDVKLAGTWLSAPLVADSADDTPSYWILTKPHPHAWHLVLRRDETVIVSYRYRDAGTCDCTFPLRLQRDDEVDPSRWPTTVLIAHEA